MRWVLTLIALVSLAAGAEQVTVGGKPVPGMVEGSGSATMAELAQLLLALDVPYHPAYSGWCVTRQRDGEDCPAKELAGPDQVIVEGRPVGTRRVGDKLLVNVSALAERLRIPLSHPKADVLELTPEAPPQPPVAGYQPLVASGAPGAEVELAKKLVPGRTNLVLYYTDWCPACWKFWPFLEALNRSQRDVALVGVNIHDFKSAVAKQYQVRMTPWIQVYDPQGKLLASGPEADKWIEKTYGARVPTTLKCVGSPDK